MKCIKKQIVCEYERLTDSSLETVKRVLEFIGQKVNSESEITNDRFWDYCNLVDEQGGIYPGENIFIGISDYIVKNTNGEFYPVNPDTFTEMYEIVDDDR